MYTPGRLPASLDGIESLNFFQYWNAIKNKINDLRQLPVWATNHAMKLGLVVSKLQREGKHQAVAGMELEIRKVNDDIAKAWKVKGYIDKYLPDWMAAANTNGAPIVQATQGPGQMVTVPAPITPSVTMRPGIPVYQEPSLAQQLKGWVGSWFGSGGVSAFPQDGGLGFVPIVATIVGLPALAYVVTTGMALYQDYYYKKDLTTATIEGKLTSGQTKDLLTGSRPAESVFEKLGIGVGSNLVTMALVAGAGYIAFQYIMTKKLTERSAS